VWLLDSLPGIYVVQTFLHSLSAILIIERAMQIWQVRNPLTQFRYRIMTLILPVCMLPLYHLIDFERSSFAFRQEKAIFSMNRWLSLEIWDLVPLTSVFMVLLAVTSVVFFLQEVVPIVRDLLARKGDDSYFRLPSDPAIDDLTRQMSEKLGIGPPPVTVLEDENPFIFTSGSRSHTLVLTSGLIKVLDREQLKSAIVHELAHIARMSNATKWMIFLIRVLMFFNPIVLIVFRRIVQDDEHVCDDITVSLTESPHVLASTLKVFYSSHSEFFTDTFVGVKEMKEGVENYSHNLLLKERIARLESTQGYEDAEFEWGKFLLTTSVVAVINYFVV
jgi:beta-lactamase regulating signal transducer with metallopeptidase domain